MRPQITKLWAGHDFAARSHCDLDLQARDPNLARDTSWQHGGYFCKIILKSDFKIQSYGPDTNGADRQGGDYMPLKFSGSIKIISITSNQSKTTTHYHLLTNIRLSTDSYIPI